MTAEQRDKAQERSQARYDRIYSEIEFETRCAWESEFGGNPAFPFVPNGTSIHREAQRRVELDQRHDAEESVG